MSSPSSLYAAILAFSVVFAGFSILIVSTPVGYPYDTVWDHGLIRDVVFDGGDYRVLDIVNARLVYRNPSAQAVSFNLTFPVDCVIYVDGRRESTSGTGAEGEVEIVTIPAGGEYTAYATGFGAESTGWYEVDWGGVRRGVAVARSEAVPRIVTDKNYYVLGDGGGTAVFEYYNPTGYNVTFNPPGCLEFERVYPDGGREGLYAVCLDWAYGNFTIPPGGSHKIWEFYFSMSRAGSFVIEGEGARTAVYVLLPVVP